MFPGSDTTYVGRIQSYIDGSITTSIVIDHVKNFWTSFNPLMRRHKNDDYDYFDDHET